jgi:formyl-CoA transferase
MMGESAQDAAIAGIRVVELSEFGAGASCAQMLAWLGADVVRVEPPGGVSARHANSDRPDTDAYEFILLNANKRSVTCDLQSEAGKAQLRTLIASADVVVEQLVPGSVERLGLGYDAVRALNPRIVYAQIEGFAAGGPRAGYLATDRVAL